MERGIAMSKYLVKLLPLGKFFFGGDMTFKVNDKETAFSSYIIHSFMMPQQTSILGMMRFLILSNNTEAFDRKGNCIKHVDKANALIGEKGFSVDPSNHSRRNYQSVQEIGACFLWNTDKNKPFFRGAKDMDLQIGKESVVNATINMIPVRIPKIDIKKGNEKQPFTGKDYLNNYYISLDGEKLNESDIFKEDTRIGINKSYTGKTESEAFYKQVSYRLKENFCFAFEVETEVDLTKYQNRLVQLGADSSSFLLEVEQNTVGYPQSKNDLQVVLVSDAYIESTEGLKIRFAVTRVRPFRFLHTGNSKNPQNYNTRYNSIRQKRYDLYEAGSVFYFKDKESRDKFCEYLDSFKEFTQIGYNQFAK